MHESKHSLEKLCIDEDASLNFNYWKSVKVTSAHLMLFSKDTLSKDKSFEHLEIIF